MWDEVDIYQGFTNRSPVFHIGTLEPTGPKTYTNPVKIALHYQTMLEQGLAQSQADLASLLGVSRAKVTQMLNLLKLDEEIQEFILGLDETDERLKMLTERRLRELVKVEDGEVQREQFWEIIDC